MKRFLALLFCFALLGAFCSAALANDREVQGEVMKINPADMTFEMKDADGRTLSVKVTPASKIETKSKNLIFNEKKVDFNALKTGQWVKVEYEGRTTTLVADEITIYLQ